VRKAAYFARILRARYYAVHISSHEGLAAVAAARAEGAEVVAETCPQYLVLNLEEHASRGALVKFNPPVRHRRDAEALWGALAGGAIQCLGSDHVPNLRARKMPDASVESATAGGPGTGVLLPLLWTYGVAAHRIGPSRLVELCSENPARAFGIFPRKGALRPGSDADLVLVDPDTPRRVEPSRLHSWADFSPYEGLDLVGWPVLTLLRGRVIAQHGAPVGGPTGRYVWRPVA
jgi:dihydropyrimidinase